MKKFLKDLLDSFRINESGFSSRKLTAFVIIILIIVIHAKWIALGNFSQLEMVLTIDYTFVSALFGMTTFQSLKNFSNKQDKKNEEE